MKAKPSPAGSFWWQTVDVGRRVAPFDYPPARLAEARGRAADAWTVFEREVRKVVAAGTEPQQVIRGVTRLVQAALIHPPVLQPAWAPLGYWWWRSLAPTGWSRWPRLAELLGQRLVTEPEVLLALGEGRCGQCVALLCAGLRLAGFAAQPWQLPHHVVAEVAWSGGTGVIDADAFKNGIMLDWEGSLPTRAQLEARPYLVDRFKPTGWMFRRDSAYARDGRTGRAYRGYVDFHSPEEDGQISARYGAARVLRPPGVPRWAGAETPLTTEAGGCLEVPFACRYPERASGYRVRVGRTSRGYTYDALVPARLHHETAGVVIDQETSTPVATLRLREKGRYFVTAAAVPAFLAEFPSYVWWSDELVVDVV